MVDALEGSRVQAALVAALRAHGVGQAGAIEALRRAAAAGDVERITEIVVAGLRRAEFVESVQQNFLRTCVNGWRTTLRFDQPCADYNFGYGEDAGCRRCLGDYFFCLAVDGIALRHLRLRIAAVCGACRLRAVVVGLDVGAQAIEQWWHCVALHIFDG